MMNGVPNEVKGWNWGAFMFNIFWGLGNKTYLPLLCLVPIVSMIWSIVCGFKGNEWAWVSGEFSANEIEKFKAIQNTWNRAGLVSFIIVISLIVLLPIGMFFLLSAFVN